MERKKKKKIQVIEAWAQKICQTKVFFNIECIGNFEVCFFFFLQNIEKFLKLRFELYIYIWHFRSMSSYYSHPSYIWNFVSPYLINKLNEILNIICTNFIFLVLRNNIIPDFKIFNALKKSYETSCQVFCSFIQKC